MMVSTGYAFFNLNKFDKIEGSHLMIRGDTGLIWHEAEAFKNDFLEKKTFFGDRS